MLSTSIVYQISFLIAPYATDNLKKLARCVLQRLAGQGGNPVVDVQVAYGGGKTHALIALLHLAEQGDKLHTHQNCAGFYGIQRSRHITTREGCPPSF